MILRVYKENSCIRVIKDIDRLILQESGQMEVRSEANEGFKWDKFRRGTDYDSMVLNKE